MSEQKSSFMQDLDLWSEANVFRPLFGTDPNQGDWQSVEAQVKHAIREKVLESYKNGCRAGAGHVRKELQQPVSKPAGRVAR